jgi:hypothetical protein
VKILIDMNLSPQWSSFSPRGEAVAAAIVDHAADLERGALITLDPDKLRMRILPIILGLKT